METEKITWTRPNGSEILTNSEKETIEHCEKMGWTRDGGPKKSTALEAVAEIEATEDPEDLNKFADDDRKTVQDALNKKLNALLK